MIRLLRNVVLFDAALDFYTSAFMDNVADDFLNCQSCMEVLSMWGASCIREMGCDTRRVIRAVLYAAMLDNHSILQTCGNLNDCCQVIAHHLS